MTSCGLLDSHCGGSMAPWPVGIRLACVCGDVGVWSCGWPTVSLFSAFLFHARIYWSVFANRDQHMGLKGWDRWQNIGSMALVADWRACFICWQVALFARQSTVCSVRLVPFCSCDLGWASRLKCYRSFAMGYVFGLKEHLQHVSPIALLNF